MSIRVVIADDQAMVRQGLRSLLEGEAGNRPDGGFRVAARIPCGNRT